MSFENKLDRPLLPETPRESLGPVVRETVLLEGRSFTITRQGQSDKLLDLPVVRSNYELDEYMPYWAELWPGVAHARQGALAGDLAGRADRTEVGCGLGLPGVVALSLGMRVPQRLRRNRPALRRRQRPGQRLQPFRDAANGLAIPAGRSAIPCYWRRTSSTRWRNVGTAGGAGEEGAGAGRDVPADRSGPCADAPFPRHPSLREGLEYTTQLVRARRAGRPPSQGYSLPHPPALITMNGEEDQG